MPKVLEINGYKYFFFSNEGNPQEPCHIHVRKAGNLAKFWIGESGFIGRKYRLFSFGTQRNQENRC